MNNKLPLFDLDVPSENTFTKKVTDNNTLYAVVLEEPDGTYKVLVRQHTDMRDPEFREVADLTCKPKFYKTLQGARQRCDDEYWYFRRRNQCVKLSVWTWCLVDIDKKVWEGVIK